MNERGDINKKNSYRWWQMRISDQTTRPLISGTPLISRHVLNLRPTKLTTKTPATNKVTTKREAKRNHYTFIDLTRTHHTKSTWRSDLIWQVAKKSPKISELSIMIVLDFLLYSISKISHSILYYYLRSTYFIWEILKSVGRDFKEFLQIITYPFGLLNKPLKLASATYSTNQGAWLLRGALSFAALALIVALPIKGLATWQKLGLKENEIKKLVNSALESFKTGGNNFNAGNTEAATLKFAESTEAFTLAQNVIGEMPTQIASIIKQIPGSPKKIISLTHLLSASQNISRGASLITSTWSELIDNNLSENKPTNLPATLFELKNILASATSSLAKVDPHDLPTELQPKIIYLQTELNRLTDVITSALDIPALINEIINNKEEKNYVFLFQNSAELRPTGGFFGSLAFISVKDGAVTGLSIPGGGPYDFQGQLSKNIRPPEPIRLLRGAWQLQDANWWFDFKASAQKILWFIKNSAGPEADGVIAITPDLALDLLKLTGPINMPKYKKIITADNFMIETQSAVELEYDKTINRPKQFIADLFPELINRTLSLPADKKMELITILEKALRAKNIQFYFTDEYLQEQFSLLGFSGEVKQVPLDYLAVVHTNIGGGKTDAVINNKITHSVEILPTGDLVANVTITRTHNGNPKNIFESRHNVDYLRLYVPAGAELLEATGATPPPLDYFRAITPGANFDDDLLATETNEKIHTSSGTRETSEFGKTVFANWLSISPGESRTLTYTYKLPFTLSAQSDWQDLRRYSVYFQKQAGVTKTSFSSTLKMPTSWRARFQDGSRTLTAEPRAIKLSSSFEQDEYYGVLLENIKN